MLIGRLEPGRKTLLATLPVANAREEEARHHRSLITPEELLRGERYARERGCEVIGNYHSHPDGAAVPSNYDLEHAWPTWSYIIVTVRRARAAEVLSWVMEPDRSCFQSEEITLACKGIDE